MKNRSWLKTIAIVIGVIVVTLGAVRIIFDEEFDDFSRYIELRENYEGDKKEFDRNFEKMEAFIENYKEQNPGASDKEAEQAFKDAAEFGEAEEEFNQNNQ